MAIRIPNLQDRNCKLLIVCGDLKTKDKETLNWLKRQPHFFMARRGSGYVGTFFHGRGEGGFHVEVVSKEFAIGRPEKPRHKMADIQEVFAHLENHEIDAEIQGYFTLPTTGLPPLIRASMVATQADDVSIQAVGGAFLVRGAPVYRIQWSLSSETDQVIISLEAKKTTTINEQYLEEALDLVESAFLALIQGEKRNA